MSKPAVCYLRVAQTSRGGYVFNATNKPSRSPLASATEALPTVCVKLVLNLPPGAFDPAIAVLEADVPERNVEVAMELREPNLGDSA